MVLIDSYKPAPEVITLVPCSTQLSMKCVLLINLKMFSCQTSLSMKISLRIIMKCQLLLRFSFKGESGCIFSVQFITDDHGSS